MTNVGNLAKEAPRRSRTQQQPTALPLLSPVRLGVFWLNRILGKRSGPRASLSCIMQLYIARGKRGSGTGDAALGREPYYDVVRYLKGCLAKASSHLGD